MFDSIGWAEILVLVVAGLFVLGPERLPEATRWLGTTVRRAKDYATGAQTKIRSELGPEFDEIAKPLGELKRLRGLDPRRAVFDALIRDEPSTSDVAPSAAPGPATAVADPSAVATRRPAADYDAT